MRMTPSACIWRGYVENPTRHTINHHHSHTGIPYAICSQQEILSARDSSPVWPGLTSASHGLSECSTSGRYLADEPIHSSSHSIWSSLYLNMLRIIPDNSQCINFVVDGDINGLKFLFDRGLASPQDISSTRGYSLLRWALYSK